MLNKFIFPSILLIFFTFKFNSLFMLLNGFIKGKLLKIETA
jgi:hypothetical protein